MAQQHAYYSAYTAPTLPTGRDSGASLLELKHITVATAIDNAERLVARYYSFCKPVALTHTITISQNNRQTT
jgi:hypothetical protein